MKHIVINSILIVGLAFLWACDDDSESEIDPSLVGTWTYASESLGEGETVTLNDDGTGVWTDSEGDTDNITWSVQGQILTLSISYSEEYDGVIYTGDETISSTYATIGTTLYHYYVFRNNSATAGSINGTWISKDAETESESGGGESYSSHYTQSSTMTISGMEITIDITTTEEESEPGDTPYSETYEETYEGTLRIEGSMIYCTLTDYTSTETEPSEPPLNEERFLGELLATGVIVADEDFFWTGSTPISTTQ